MQRLSPDEDGIMKGWIFTNTALKKVANNIRKSGATDSTVSKHMRNIRLLITSGVIVGKIIPLDEEFCFQRAYAHGHKYDLNHNKLRSAIIDLLTYGEVIEFDERTGRMV